jgi:hypothetical protein
LSALVLISGVGLLAGAGGAERAHAAPLPPAQARGQGLTDGPTTVRRSVVHNLLWQARSRRVDVVGLGDSNQLFNGTGFHDGLTAALGERFPMYCTPILGAGSNEGIGVAVATMEHAAFAPTGAPAALVEFNDPQTLVEATPYGFLAAGETIAGGTNVGMRLQVGAERWPKNNFDETSALRFHFDYGVAPGEVEGFFRPQAIQSGAFNVVGDPVTTRAAEAGILSGHVDVPAGVRSVNDVRFRWASSTEASMTGPVFGLYMRAENLDEPAGFAAHTLYGLGGASAQDCLLALLSASDEQLITYFDRVRALQPAPKRVLVRIALGANDATDRDLSVGPVGGFKSNTDAGVQDNLRGIILRIRGIWAQAGWDQSEVKFLLTAPHHRIEEDAGYGFRSAIAALAEEDEAVAFVNHYNLASSYELFVFEWYEFPTGAHLTEAGYEGMGGREIDALITPILADLNLDCRVDTADLALLLNDFGASAPNPADFNHDGVVDTADLAQLLIRYLEACQDG